MVVLRMVSDADVTGERYTLTLCCCWSRKVFVCKALQLFHQLFQVSQRAHGKGGGMTALTCRHQASTILRWSS